MPRAPPVLQFKVEAKRRPPASIIRPWNGASCCLEWAANSSKSKDFDFPHDLLLLACKHVRPKQAKATVSSFTGWLYDVMRTRRRVSFRADAMQLGEIGERWIENERRPMPSAVMPLGCALAFADPLNDSAPSFTMSRLTFNGTPLRGRPDLVFRNRARDVVIIDGKSLRRRLRFRAGQTSKHNSGATRTSTISLTRVIFFY